MALHFDVSKVKDASILNRTENGVDYWSHEVESVAFMGMLIGINPITEANHEEWYRRYVAYHVAKGYSDWFLSLGTVRKFVGFSSNVTTVTSAAWRKRLAEWTAETADAKVREEVRVMAEADAALVGVEVDEYPEAQS